MMGHFFIYPSFLFMILGFRDASGIQCYGESGTPEQCAGVCGTMTALEDGTTTDGQQIRNGETQRGCLPDKDVTGCIEMDFVGIRTRGCFCNTDLCNGSGGGRGTGDKERGGTGTGGDTTSGKSGIEEFFKRPVVIGGIAGGVALIVLICCIVCCCRKK